MDLACQGLGFVTGIAYSWKKFEPNSARGRLRDLQTAVRNLIQRILQSLPRSRQRFWLASGAVLLMVAVLIAVLVAGILRGAEDGNTTQVTHSREDGSASLILSSVTESAATRRTPTAQPIQSGGAGASVSRLDDALAEPIRQAAISEQLGTPAPPASIVYVIDDSGSMDADYVEVRAALRKVRDTDAPNTKVALLAFGGRVEIRFKLRSHSSAPWDEHIDSFGGYLGGTYYEPPLTEALELLKEDSASVKTIVFMTDGQQDYPLQVMREIVSAEITVDTVAFGNQYTENFHVLERIARDTGGSYRVVPKPAAASASPPVAPRPLSAILPESAAASTATLYALDGSLSLHMDVSEESHSANMLEMLIALRAVERKVRGIATARVGVATTLFADGRIDFGREIAPVFADGPRFRLVLDSAEEWVVYGYGGTNLDGVLQAAYDSIMSQSSSQSSEARRSGSSQRRNIALPCYGADAAAIRK